MRQGEDDGKQAPSGAEGEAKPVVVAEGAGFADLWPWPSCLVSDGWAGWHAAELPKHYYQYHLVGVIVHTGTAQAGHYYSFIKERQPGPGRASPE